MCWMCDSIQPCDGPSERRIADTLMYRDDQGKIRIANDAADWELLDDWPAWDAVDAQGIPYFDQQ